jgi:hypothetical protein
MYLLSCTSDVVDIKERSSQSRKDIVTVHAYSLLSRRRACKRDEVKLHVQAEDDVGSEYPRRSFFVQFYQ